MPENEELIFFSFFPSSLLLPCPGRIGLCLRLLGHRGKELFLWWHELFWRQPPHRRVWEERMPGGQLWTRDGGAGALMRKRVCHSRYWEDWGQEESQKPAPNDGRGPIRGPQWMSGDLTSNPSRLGGRSNGPGPNLMQRGDTKETS